MKKNLDFRESMLKSANAKNQGENDVESVLEHKCNKNRDEANQNKKRVTFAADTNLEPHENYMSPKLKNVSHAEIHAKLGHPGHDMTRATAKKLGCHVVGDKHCDQCKKAKGKQKVVKKFNKNRAVHRANCLCIDLSWVKKESLGGNRYWLLVVCEATDKCWSHFLKNKSDLGKEVIRLLDTLEGQGIKLQKTRIRLDNSGEN